MKQVIAIIMLLSASVFAGYDFVIQDGDYFEAITLTDSQSILINGGGGYHLNLNNYSTATIKNTSPLISEGNGGIWRIYLYGDSYIEMSGGEIHQLIPSTYTQSHLSGGQIDEIWSNFSIPDTSRITLVCKPGYQITYTDGLATKISGIWLNGVDFSIKFVNPSGKSPVLSNMTIIPEPASLLLIGLGGLLVRRK